MKAFRFAWVEYWNQMEVGEGALPGPVDREDWFVAKNMNLAQRQINNRARKVRLLEKTDCISRTQLFSVPVEGPGNKRGVYTVQARSLEEAKEVVAEQLKSYPERWQLDGEVIALCQGPHVITQRLWDNANSSWKPNWQL